MSAPPQLRVSGLSVAFHGEGRSIPVVHDLSFTLGRGETLALVGESGSGKSVTGLAAMRLTPGAPLASVRGQVLLQLRDGPPRDLLALREADMRRIRGNEIAMIFQEPLTSLNPVHMVGRQIAEVLIHHRNLAASAAWQKAIELLDLVGISEPRRRAAGYPHQLSGGMRQRVMIAMALACDPSVLIADEPTTALDVTVQAQILELMKSLQARTGMSMIFITHNLGLVAEIADRVLVMYAGRIVEEGATEEVLLRPRMPYTIGLLRSVPRLEASDGGRSPLEPIGGQVPEPGRLPPGCAFHPRCRHAVAGRCDVEVPALQAAGQGHFARCLRLGELAETAA